MFPLLTGIDADIAATSFGRRLGLRSPVHRVRITDAMMERKALSLMAGSASALIMTEALVPIDAAMSRIPASLISVAGTGPE